MQEYETLIKRVTLVDKAQGGHTLKNHHKKLIAKHRTVQGLTNPGSSDGDNSPHSQSTVT